MTDTIDTLLVNTPYRITGFLGRGGMGEVYRVEHTFLGREFALKVLFARHSENPGVVDRMRIEAQATARLAHPNIVDVSDFWLTPGGRPCIVMELLQGTTVARELTVRGPFSVQLAVEYTHQLLAALMAAHNLGVVHRDIKPQNLFLHDLPKGSRILKVLDFGIARVVPELRGEQVDQRADVFSAGLVLYSMLTNRGPFDGMRMTDSPQTFQVQPPSQRIDALIPPELDTIVLKAIRWDASERYQSVSAFAADLQWVRDTQEMEHQ